MPYITSIERSAIERGRKQAFGEDIRVVLEVRFGPEGLELLEQLKLPAAVESLRRLHRTLAGASTLEEAAAALREAAAADPGEPPGDKG
jgi:hypothetical protein